MITLMTVGIAHAVDPSECGELHNDIVDHFMQTEMPTGTFQEVHDEVMSHVSGLDIEHDGTVAAAWMTANDPAAYAAAEVERPELMAHIDALAQIYWTRTANTAESDILDALADLDVAALATLSGADLDLALCIASVARSSTTYWHDRTEDWIVLADDGGEGPNGSGMGTYKPSDQVNGSDVLQADAVGAAQGAAGGVIYSLASGGTLTAPALIGGAVIGAAVNSVWEGGEQKNASEAQEATSTGSGTGDGENIGDDTVDATGEEGDNGDAPAP